MRFDAGVFFDAARVDREGMASDDTLARLKALSDRLEKIRRQAQEIYSRASDEVRASHTGSRDRGVPNFTERRAVRRS